MLRTAKPYILSAMITLVFAAVFFAFLLPNHIGEYKSRGWSVYYEQRDGVEYRVEEKEITASDAGSYMKVITTRQYLDVFVGGENVFSYAGGADGLPHRGIFPIEIRGEYIGKIIRLEMTSPYPKDNHMMGEQYSVDGYGLATASRDFACGIISLVIGVSIAVVAAMMVAAKIGRLIVWMLAASVLLFSGFVLSNTRPAMLLMNPHVMYWLYMTGFLFYPIFMFIYLFISHTEALKKVLLPFMLLPVLVVAGCIVLDAAEIASIDRYSFWFMYIYFVSMMVLLVGAAFGRRTTGKISGVVAGVIAVWLLWGVSLLLRSEAKFNHEYIVVYTLICAIEMFDNVIRYTKQLIGMRYRDLYLTEKNRHLSRYYENIEQHMHDISLLKHEMSHHLTTLNYLHRDRAFEKAGTYLERIGAQYQATDAAKLCDHHIVNAVLCYLKSEAERMSSTFELSCHVPGQFSMRDEDISSLLLNLAENALEGCAPVEEANRRIKLTVRVENHLFFLRMENSTDKELQQKDGRFMSAKRRYERQGYGLEIVESIVAQYEGTMEASAEGGRFKIELLLNLPYQ